ncbi:MAG: preprotein translocase subunit YajC [Bacteroidota bacterium]|jgi:preprotein translocase subunit YajC
MYNLLLIQAATDAPNPLVSFGPFVLLIIVFYFFMIRPQMKRQKETKKFRAEIKKGDKVITVSGIHGRISEVEENTVVLEIATGVKITVEKAGIINGAENMPQQR